MQIRIQGTFVSDVAYFNFFFTNDERKNAIRRGEGRNFEHMQLPHFSSEAESNWWKSCAQLLAIDRTNVRRFLNAITCSVAIKHTKTC